jgi:hypothetical protein
MVSWVLRLYVFDHSIGEVYIYELTRLSRVRPVPIMTFMDDSLEAVEIIVRKLMRSDCAYAADR